MRARGGCHGRAAQSGSPHRHPGVGSGRGADRGGEQVGPDPGQGRQHGAPGSGRADRQGAVSALRPVRVRVRAHGAAGAENSRSHPRSGRQSDGAGADRGGEPGADVATRAQCAAAETG